MTVIPKDYWTAASRIAKENAINYVLNQRLIHSQYKQTVRDLQQLSVPSLRPDAIEIATTLLQLGVKDSTIDEVVEFIISKANHQGRWVAEKVHSNTYGQWGKKGEENKWITFRVLRMLKIADRL